MRGSLASAVSEPRQSFVACEDCAARLALSLPQHLVSPPRDRSCHRMLQFYAHVVYVQRPLYKVLGMVGQCWLLSLLDSSVVIPLELQLAGGREGGEDRNFYRHLV